MRILLTNDDGIQSDGFQFAYKALSAAGHSVVACAPDRERSAQSQSISLYSCLQAKEVDMPDGAIGFAVNGTPADCTRLGCHLMKDQPADLVVSGINTDCNLGYDANYSGTVGAALEGLAAGYPALAVSLERSANYDWLQAADIAVKAASLFFTWNLPIGAMVNLNIPAVISNPEWIWTSLNHIPAKETYVQEKDDEGRLVYRRTRLTEFSEAVPGSDVALFQAGRITLSPVGPVRTDWRTLTRLTGLVPADPDSPSAQTSL
ncbi:MAG: 5'/3'-nucleotidase SurE [Deltaproteobacteria bacterium]|jgi:5'-nucleotidase|nr:5'/3'-nucleotidase SurE [Deltaproteobacteria bacterium]